MKGNVRILYVCVPWTFGMKTLYVAAVIEAGIPPVVAAGAIGVAHMIGGFIGALKSMSIDKPKPEFILSIFAFSFGVGATTGLTANVPWGSFSWVLSLVATWLFAPYIFREIAGLLGPSVRSYEGSGRSTFAIGLSCWFTMIGGLACMRFYPNEPDLPSMLIGPGIALFLFVIAYSLSRRK